MSDNSVSFNFSIFVSLQKSVIKLSRPLSKKGQKLRLFWTE